MCFFGDNSGLSWSEYHGVKRDPLFLKWLDENPDVDHQRIRIFGAEFQEDSDEQQLNLLKFRVYESSWKLQHKSIVFHLERDCVHVLLKMNIIGSGESFFAFKKHFNFGQKRHYGSMLRTYVADDDDSEDYMSTCRDLLEEEFGNSEKMEIRLLTKTHFNHLSTRKDFIFMAEMKQLKWIQGDQSYELVPLSEIENYVDECQSADLQLAFKLSGGVSTADKFADVKYMH